MQMLISDGEAMLSTCKKYKLHKRKQQLPHTNT